MQKARKLRVEMANCAPLDRAAALAARFAVAAGGRQEQQGSGRRTRTEHQNGRDTPGQYHDPPQLPFHQRIGVLRGAKPHNSAIGSLKEE